MLLTVHKGALAVFTSLARVHRGGLVAHLSEIMPGIKSGLEYILSWYGCSSYVIRSSKAATTAVKLDTLEFIQALLQTTAPEEFTPFIPELVAVRS